jgi:hypothetical protein
MPLEQREISILLSFVADPKSRAEIQKAFDGLGGGFKSSKEAAEALNAEFAELAANIAKIQDPTKQKAGLEALSGLKATSTAALQAAESNGTLNTTFLQQREVIRGANKDTEKLNAGLTETAKGANTARRSIENFGGAMRWAMMAEGMRIIGRTIAGAGRSVIGMASNYAKGAPENDAVAKRWLSAMERIDQAQMRIGRTLAAQINPFLEQAAKLAEQVADFADKHPEAMAAIAKLAIGGAVVGGALTNVAAPFAMYAGALRMTGGIVGGGGAGALGSAAQAATGLGTTAATGLGIGIGQLVAIAGAVVLALVAEGILLKIVAAEDIRKNEEASRAELETLKRVRSGEIKDPRELAKISGSLPGLGQAGFAARVDARIKQLEEALSSLGDTAEQTTGKLDKGVIQSFIQYQQQESAAAIQYNEQRNKIEEQYAAQRVEIEARYEQQRTDLIKNFAAQQAQALDDFSFGQARQARDFAANEAQIEADYYASRSQALADYQDSVKQAEEDHQREMRNLRLDHEARMDDLVASRDALGMVREMRSYERQRSEAEDAHAAEMRKLKADAADRLQEMEAQFAKEKERRMADFQQRIADQQEDFNRQRDQQKKEFQERLAAIAKQAQDELLKLKTKNAAELRELADQYAKEKAKRYAAFVQQLADLDLFTGKMKSAWDKYYADAEAQLKAFIAKAQGMTTTPATRTTPGRAGGGYVGSGMYRLHNGEYVLNSATTRQAERFVGGGLTQGSLAAALAGGGGVTIQNLVMPGNNMNEQQFTRFVQDKFPGLLANALQKARANVPGV